MSAIKPLQPAMLRRHCDPESFSFETTAELEELTEIVGQARAVEAVRFGIDIRREGYNLFVLGPPGGAKWVLRLTPWLPKRRGRCFCCNRARRLEDQFWLRTVVCWY